MGKGNGRSVYPDREEALQNKVPVLKEQEKVEKERKF